MAEKYGIQSKLIQSEAQTPVAVGTELVVIGFAKELANYLKPVKITSYDEFVSTFGADKLSLERGVYSALRLANLDHVWVINCTNANSLTVATCKNAEVIKGINVLDDIYMEHGVIPNLVVVPWTWQQKGDQTTQTQVLAAAKTKCGNIADRFKAQVVYDIENKADQVVDGKVVVEKITPELKDECALAVFGDVIIEFNSGNIVDVVPGSTYVAALRALQDSKNTGGIPYRSVGNLDAPSCLGICHTTTNRSVLKLSYAEATDVQEKGIITWLNQGRNRFTTWGDHTAAFTSGVVSDERARFDSNIAVAYHLSNRFIEKWRSIVDSPFDLSIRNDIIVEENEYLDYLKVIGALVGDTRCEFRELDNSSDTLAKGEFYFTNIYTHSIPAKYIQINNQYTDAGLSVLVEG